MIGLSNDHKPTDNIEMERILGNNGRIYQNASIVRANNPQSNIKSQIVLGPHRVFPGRLSVCRTFGDIEAKLSKLDGNARVVIADPHVTASRIDRHKHDFIMIGCDGIYSSVRKAAVLNESPLNYLGVVVVLGLCKSSHVLNQNRIFHIKWIIEN